MVGKCGIDTAYPIGYGAHRCDVGLDIAVELFVAQFRKGLDLEALIGILDVDREEAADVGVVDLDAFQLDLAVLAEQMDLVAEASQGTGQVGGRCCCRSRAACIRGR